MLQCYITFLPILTQTMISFSKHKEVVLLPEHQPGVTTLTTCLNVNVVEAQKRLPVEIHEFECRVECYETIGKIYIH